MAADRHVVCWCAACDLMCTVVLGALVGTEPRGMEGGGAAGAGKVHGVSGRGLLLDLGGTAFRSGLEQLALLGEREPAVRSIVARRGPIGPEPDPLWDAMLRGEITERGYWRGAIRRGGRGAGAPDWPITAFMHLLLRPGARTWCGPPRRRWWRTRRRRGCRSAR